MSLDPRIGKLNSGLFYAYVNGHNKPPTFGTQEEVEAALGLRERPNKPSPAHTSIAPSIKTDTVLWDVKLTFQYPAWDLVDGIWFYEIAANSKSDANAEARRIAHRDGHLGGKQGRATFTAFERESNVTTEEQKPQPQPITITAWHGRNADASERFGHGLTHPSPRGTWGPGLYFADTFESAATYADIDNGGVVIEASITMANPFFFTLPRDAEEEFGELVGLAMARTILSPDEFAAIDPETLEDFDLGPEISDRLLAMGHDGAVISWYGTCKEILLLPGHLHKAQAVEVHEERPSSHPRMNGHIEG